MIPRTRRTGQPGGRPHVPETVIANSARGARLGRLAEGGAGPAQAVRAVLADGEEDGRHEG